MVSSARRREGKMCVDVVRHKDVDIVVKQFDRRRKRCVLLAVVLHPLRLRLFGCEYRINDASVGIEMVLVVFFVVGDVDDANWQRQRRQRLFSTDSCVPYIGRGCV